MKPNKRLLEVELNKTRKLMEDMSIVNSGDLGNNWDPSHVIRKTQGLTTSFYAFFCHYTIYRLFREPQSGYFFMKQVTFVGRIRGHMSMFSVFGTFHGTPYT